MNLQKGLSALRRMRGMAFVAILSLIVALVAVPHETHVLIFLPGTQPGTVDTLGSAGAQECRTCHYSPFVSRPVHIARDWSGSMMAHSARDPIFYAAMAVANKDAGVAGLNPGEFCIRCHSPTGWLAGHSEDITGQSLRGTDLDGVQCDYCHRAVNPIPPDSTVPPMTYPVPGYGNGMHALQKTLEPKRGPYDSVSAPHGTRVDPFQKQSELCGVCHDVSNPFHAGYQNQITKAPFEYSPIERTYSEWLMSWYATQGDSGTCQSCHMSRTTGYACIYGTSPLRSDIARHDLTGGNTFVPDILRDFTPDLDSVALVQGRERARATLQRAATLDLYPARFADHVSLTVRVTNLTGHKLPTGYPDGRKMWLHVVGRNAAGDTVMQSGAYDADSARLVRDAQVKVYETLHGLTDSVAALFGVQPGPSFHFALNDTIFFDNRIPPRGFTNAGYLSRLAMPVGATYADSQYWDDTKYVLPASVKEVTVALCYQTISREYIGFLKDQNQDNLFDWNDWGGKLFASWNLHGKSEPVPMTSMNIAVPDSISTGINEDKIHLPAKLALLQNYPNPFNGSTEIRFELPSAGDITLTIYSVTGAAVATPVHRTMSKGMYQVTWDAHDLPSGVYFIALRSGHEQLMRKILLLR